MNNNTQKIGLGGGCHWCTEAVFQSLIGVEKVAQGFIASENEFDTYSEAVIVHFDSNVISLKDLIEIHLYTHKSTSEHSMRSKYRSAVYTFHQKQQEEASSIIDHLQQDFSQNIITKILPFRNFKESDAIFQNYYYSNPDKPFCERHIHPKLALLQKKFSRIANQEKIKRKETTL